MDMPFLPYHFTQIYLSDGGETPDQTSFIMTTLDSENV
jgi:hypothetical protein